MMMRIFGFWRTETPAPSAPAPPPPPPKKQIDSLKYQCPFIKEKTMRCLRSPGVCPFSHDHLAIRIPVKYCFFYLENKCQLGSKCLRRHCEPSPAAGDIPLTHLDDTVAGFQQRLKHFLGFEPKPRLLKQIYDRTKSKACGICLEIVVNKRPLELSRFGILESCDHVFCLDCITRWRRSDVSNFKENRKCPQCRVASKFVIANECWFEGAHQKEQLIKEFKATRKNLPCQDFENGRGHCPYGTLCESEH